MGIFTGGGPQGPLLQLRGTDLFKIHLFQRPDHQDAAHKAARIKRVDKARFRFENDQRNEPFGLMAYALEYVENGNYKG